MNAKVICVIGLLFGACAIGGCASMKGDSRSLAASATTDLTGQTIDEAYVARVEEQAQQRGIEVRWIHPPTLSAPPMVNDAH